MRENADLDCEPPYSPFPLGGNSIDFPNNRDIAATTMPDPRTITPPIYKCRLPHLTCKSTKDSRARHVSRSRESCFRQIERTTSAPDPLLLSPESQIALALVNETTLSILGPLNNKGGPIKPSPMSPETRRELLKLLDRDLYILVYCSMCDKIHDPTNLRGRRCTDAIRKHDEVPPGDWDWDTLMYIIPPFTAVHAIMRSYRAGQRHSSKLMTATLSTGAPVRTPLERMFCRGAAVMRQRIVPVTGSSYGSPVMEGHKASLVWMMQRVLPVNPYSNESGQGQVTTVRNFYEIGCYVCWAPRICDHRHWHLEYPFLLTDSSDLQIDQKTPLRLIRRTKADLKARFQKFHIHPKEFRGPDGKNFRESNKFVTGSIDTQLKCAIFHGGGPSDPCRHYMQFGVVRSCERCDTDYCFTVVRQEVSDPDAVQDAKGNKKTRRDNFFVFTSWKNMGSGGSRREDDPVWQAHVEGNNNAKPAVREKLQRSSGALWPYTQYGNLQQLERPGEYGRHVFTPKLSQGVIKMARSWWEWTPESF